MSQNLPPAQAMWHRAPEPNLKDSICSLWILTAGWGVSKWWQTVVLLWAAKFSTLLAGWLFKSFSALEMRTASLCQQGGDGCFHALSYLVHPNKSHLWQFPKIKQSQQGVRPGKKAQVYKLIAFNLQRVVPESSPTPSLKLQIFFPILYLFRYILIWEVGAKGRKDE